MTTKITLNNIADTALATLTGPKVTTIVYPGTETATDITGGATINLTGAGFQSGCSVLVASTASSVVTFISSTQISFIAPALSAGTYVIYVINPDGGTAISIPGISYSGTPNWTTTAGSLGSAYETGAISATLTATGDNPVTYSVASGTLPTGSSLASDGTLSGTAVATASATTYTFTVTAKDAQNQTTNRSFSLTINPDVVTWSSPADNTTYTVAKDTAISNVTMSATSAAGGSITYTADTLPTGLSITGANIAGTPTVTANTTTVLTATSTTTRTATKTINWVVNVSNDTYFKNTTLLLQGAGTTFVDDASTNNFALTVNGDTKPNNFNPYTPGYYSNYFDGTGDWISVPNNAALAFGTGDFTVECWGYITGSSGTVINYTNGQSTNSNFSWEMYQFSASEMWFSVFDGATQYIAKSTAFKTNQWNHLAAVRSGNTLTLYVNGVAGATTVAITGVSVANLASATLKVGSYNNGSSYLTGYISNLRVVKGTAVYTTTFTPPTTPLTAISNTSLLTCQSNRIIDNSTNNLTITLSGDTTVKSFQPFTPNSSYSTYGSGYFDGSGDYLSIPDNVALQLTADFTIEFWIYTTSLGSTQRIIVKGNNGASDYSIDLNTSGTFSLNNGNTVATSTGSIRVNSWNHVALTRSGTSCAWWINGVSSGTFTYSNSLNNTSAFWIGQNQSSGLGVTGYITDVRIVKGTAVYTATFTPPSQPLTAIANTSLLTLQNNQSVNNSVFLDNSTNNFLVTRNGNTTQGTFSPYGGNWSNYLPSAGSTYLFGGSSNSLALGPGNFTLEGWFYIAALAPLYSTLFDWRTNGAIIATVPVLTDFNNNGKLAFSYGNGSSTAFIQVVESSTTMPVGSWFHMALVRSGTTVTMYFNGTSVGSATSSQDFGLQNFNIGNPQPANYTPSMYVSNVRLVKGSAVYTSAFTPSTTPLTAITNTTLLTCQSPRYVDNSINNIALSATTNVSVQRFSPFNPSTVTPTSYSGYFDGTGDYLNYTGGTTTTLSGDYTFECWVYLNNLSASQPMMCIGDDFNLGLGFFITTSGKINLYGNAASIYTSTGSTVAVNTWTHIAVVRSGSTITGYINGVAQSTATNSSQYSGTTTYIGRETYNTGYATSFSGYLSNVRLVKGVAVYTGAFTVPTSPLQATQSSGTNIAAITGTSTSLLTCQSTTFIDNSTNNFTITANGDSKPTIQNPFGYTSATTNGYSVSTIGGSAYFDGSGDYLTVASSNMTNFGTGDFTVECWAYATTNPHTNGMYLFSSRTASFANSWVFYLGSGDSLTWYTNSAGIAATTATFKANQWYHFAYSKKGTTGRLFVNGVVVSTATDSQSYGYSTPLYIGASYDGSFSFQGYISDARVVKGTALYTSNFVPPSAPLTAVQNTSLLTNMTSAGIYDASTMNNLESVGDAKLSTEVTKFDGTSMYFDGTGDYLFAPTLNVNNLSKFLTSNFTVECWIYPTTTSGDRTVICAVNNWGAGANYEIELRSGLLFVQLGNGVTMTSGTTSISANTWTHIALVRSSATSTTFYVNGVSVSTYTTSWTADEDCPLTIGCFNINGGSLSNYWQGYIDDLRITKGYARYTSNFTAPTSEFKTF